MTFKNSVKLTLSVSVLVFLAACGEKNYLTPLGEEQAVKAAKNVGANAPVPGETVANPGGKAAPSAPTTAPVVEEIEPITQASSAAANTASAPNFILMIGDDMGVETISCYNVANVAAHTPNLNEMCNTGMRFDNFWAQPVCSPTRATLISGQYGFINGVGAPLGPTPDIEWNVPGGPVDDDPAAPMAGGGMAMGMGAGAIAVKSDVDLTAGAPAPVAPSENSTEGIRADIYTFIEALKTDDAKGYVTAAVGKWHLSGSGNAGLAHPNQIGFDRYIGPMRGGGIADYRGWSKSINGGDPFGKLGYITSDTVDDGIDFIDSVKGKNPFFLWVAFNAPHTPFHMPPKSLLTSNLKNVEPDIATPLEQYNAMLEAMDTEIGRLLESLDPATRANTYVVFMGDNGTPGQAGQTVPYGRTKSKGSLYQGGVNVPFIVTGPNVQSSATNALANSVDIYNTVLDLSSINPPKAREAIHSVSLRPVFENANASVRDFAYADVFGVSGPTQKNLRTIRNDRYKYIEDIMENTVEFYDLQSDPFENNNLLKAELSAEAQQNLASLKKELAELVNKR